MKVKKKPGPKKNRNIGVRGATVVMFEGKNRRLMDIATEHNLTHSALKSRWIRAGSPREIDRSILFPVNQKASNYTVTLMPDNMQMTPYKLASMFDVSHNSVAYRVRRGQLVFTREEMSAMKSRTKTKFPKLKKENYDDPEYLPHIKRGDLAHLSGTKNYGRGKGEIPDDVWINRLVTKPRNNTLNCIESIMSGFSVFSDARG